MHTSTQKHNRSGGCTALLSARTGPPLRPAVQALLHCHFCTRPWEQYSTAPDDITLVAAGPEQRAHSIAYEDIDVVCVVLDGIFALARMTYLRVVLLCKADSDETAHALQ